MMKSKSLNLVRLSMGFPGELYDALFAYANKKNITLVQAVRDILSKKLLNK